MNVSGPCSLTRAMSFSLEFRAFSLVTKILATDKEETWSSLLEPTLTFQLDTSRYFLGVETDRKMGWREPITLRLCLRLGLQVCWEIM